MHRISRSLIVKVKDSETPRERIRGHNIVTVVYLWESLLEVVDVGYFGVVIFDFFESKEVGNGVAFIFPGAFFG